MGFGIPLVVIVIFLVVWIVSNVIRAQQDAAQAAARRNVNRPNGQLARAPEKTTSSDIDRFLQEIDRLRKKGQQDQPAPAKTVSPQPLRKPLAPLSSREQQPRRSTGDRKRAPSERKPASPRSVSQAPSPPSLLLLPSSPPLPTLTAVELAHPQEATPVFKEGAVSRPSRPTQASAPISASMELLQTLFKSKQGMMTAVLLHEILGEPKSKRRR